MNNGLYSTERYEIVATCSVCGVQLSILANFFKEAEKDLETRGWQNINAMWVCNVCAVNRTEYDKLLATLKAYANNGGLLLPSQTLWLIDRVTKLESELAAEKVKLSEAVKYEINEKLRRGEFTVVKKS